MSPARAVGVLLAGLGIVALGAGALGRAPVLRPGVDGFVNADRPSLHAHNSPVVALDPARPSRVAVANRIDTPAFDCAVALSGSGGRTWQPLELPLPRGAPNCYWPDVAFDDAGRLLVLYTATGGRFNRPVGVWLQRFEGMEPHGPAVAVAGAEAYQARLAAFADRVLVTYVQAAPGTEDRPLGFPFMPNPVVLAASEDGGATFAPPVTVSEPARRVTQPSFLRADGDAVVIGALDLGDDRLDYEGAHEGQGGPPSTEPWGIVAWHAADDGSGFGPAVDVAAGLAPPTRIIVELAPAPQFASDPETGRLYAVWDAGVGHDRGVHLAVSDDGGVAWSPPVPVAPGQGAQYLPSVAVAPDGRVDVLFYDRRADPADELAVATLAASFDGGRSFAAATVSDRAFDSGIGLGSVQGLPLLGSHTGVAVLEDTSLALWSDTRHGTVASNVQDLAVALVAVTPPRRPWWSALVAGVLLLLGGGITLVAARRHGGAPAS